MPLVDIEPEDLPGVLRKASKVSDLIEEFSTSTSTSAEIEDPDIIGTRLAKLARAYIRRRDYPISVVRRGDRVFFIRQE